MACAIKFKRKIIKCGVTKVSSSLLYVIKVTMQQKNVKKVATIAINKEVYTSLSKLSS